MALLALLNEHLPFWQNLSPKQRQLFIKEVSASVYEKNQAIYSCTTKENCLWIIEKGQVAFVLQSAKGVQITLATMGAGVVTPLPLFLYTMENQPCFFAALAQEDTRLYRIPWEALLTAAAKNSAAGAYLHQQFKRLSSEGIRFISQLAFDDLGTRLLTKLNEYAVLQKNKTIIITHEALAGDLGTSREVVSRLLDQFEKQGLVKLGRKKIQILSFNNREIL